MTLGRVSICTDRLDSSSSRRRRCRSIICRRAAGTGTHGSGHTENSSESSKSACRWNYYFGGSWICSRGPVRTFLRCYAGRRLNLVEAPNNSFACRSSFSGSHASTHPSTQACFTSSPLRETWRIRAAGHRWPTFSRITRRSSGSRVWHRTTRPIPRSAQCAGNQPQCSRPRRRPSFRVLALGLLKAQRSRQWPGSFP